MKARHGITPELESCHTATVGGYVVEGHVPADLIARMLRERPAIAGLSVPGMISGTPGMDGGVPRAYDVMSFTRDGRTAVYAHREPQR